jgi:8-oxo-dGTP pyrophosphatase MutT (NUDIX family)
VQGAEIIPRMAGRVLVLDSEGQVLLQQFFDPARPAQLYWITIGGGIDAGESVAQGAARELWEEAGIRAAAADLGSPVWRRLAEFSFDGVMYRQQEDYFVLRVGHVQVSLDGLEEIERQIVTGYGWWSAEEIEASDEVFLPPELPELLRRLSS